MSMHDGCGCIEGMPPCDCVCHRRGLNPWIKECPRCGCGNPKFDPEAKSDIEYEEPMDVGLALGLFTGFRF